MTNKLIQAGLLFDIKVVDHVIVTRHSYFSFATNGLIEKLRWDRKYALTFIHDKQVAEKIRDMKRDAEKEKKKFGKEREKLGEKRGEEEGAKTREKQIARQMIIDGKPFEEIKKYTGLPVQWLGRLKSEIARERR